MFGEIVAGEKCDCTSMLLLLGIIRGGKFMIACNRTKVKVIVSELGETATWVLH